MPRKLCSGVARLVATRKAPLPNPTSISTGWSLPNTVDQGRGAGHLVGLKRKGCRSASGKELPRLRTAGLALRGLTLAEGEPDDVRLEHHHAVHEALRRRQHLAAVHLGGLGHEDEAIPRPHRSTKAHVLHAAEGNEVAG